MDVHRYDEIGNRFAHLRLSRRTALRASGVGLAAASLGHAGFAAAQSATPSAPTGSGTAPAGQATPSAATAPVVDLALPLMYIAPQRTLSRVYVSADTLSRFHTIHQTADAQGVTISSLYTYFDAAQKRYIGVLILDQTDAHAATPGAGNWLASVPGVQILASGGPSAGLIGLEQDHLNVAGTPVVVMARPFLGATHMSVIQTFGDQGAKLLFQVGENAGHTAASGVPDLVKSLGLQLTPALIKERLYDIQVFGWGTVASLQVNDQFVGEAHLTDDFEATAWQGKATTSVCDFIRGFLTGAVSSLTGHAVTVSEPECQGKGDPYCRMVFTQ